MSARELARYDRTLGAIDGRDAVTARSVDYARRSFLELSADHQGPSYVVGFLEGMCDATPGRECIRCGLDITDVMGVYLFVRPWAGRIPPEEGCVSVELAATRGPLLCLTHGAGTGANIATLATVREWIAGRLTSPEGVTL